ncbi:hypothetical protein ACQ4PT_012191 [Festuca glaucescens]
MGTQSLQYDATLRCSPKRKFQSHAISTPDEPPSKKTLLFNSPEGSVNSSSLGIPKNSGRVARSTPDVPSLEIPPTVDAHDGFEEGERQTEDLVETALVNNANNAAMSSSGDPTQLDGQALLELQNASAAKIQRYWKALQLRRLEARESFCRTLSTLVQNVDWNCFGPDSDFLRQLLFFFNAKRGEDVDMLCKICDILLLYVRSDGTYVDGTIPIDNDANYYLDVDLQRHILTLFQHLVNAAVSGILSIDFSDSAGLSSTELQFVGSISFFLHGMLHSSITDGIMTELVHTTEIVPALWNFIKSCHTNDKWQFFSKYCSQLLPDAPGWLLPLSIFCPMYSHILQFMDIVELKKSERYVSLEDLPSLVFILKEALWELLLTIPLQSSSLQTTCSPLDNKKMLTQVLKSSVMTGLCELLIQLEKWNNMDQFVPPIGFCSTKAISDEFASQALIVGTHEAEIIRLAPFLVPFDTRLEIFQIQIVFFNEHGMKEAGVDAGGIFREFMNIITQSAFSLESRLFKETADHLLYPNPESKLAHADHLQYFHFLGVLLGKAMYEGITVCLPFTIFFLRKLKQKETFFNDLFSLDPELYRTLVNLKPKNSDDLSYIYFIAPDGKELFPGGARMHVTAHNVTTYMHLVANYQLNCQNRVQTAQFVRGFQQLIPKEWTDMFNEHEFQLLISGSLSLNVEDLQLNTNYSGEYHMDHVVIVMFWNVLRKFSGRDQERFLMFVTGSARGPIRGFGTLNPKFGIKSYGDDPSRLPLASTCFNQLHLPPYQTEEQMHAKLIQALSSKSGFDLM